MFTEDIEIKLQNVIKIFTVEFRQKVINFELYLRKTVSNYIDLEVIDLSTNYVRDFSICLYCSH